MEKVLLKKFLISIIVVLFCVMGVKIVTLLQHKAQIEHSLATVPDFSLQTIEGTPFTKAQLPENVAIVFIYFNTENKKTYHIALSHPKENLSKATVEAVAQKIVDTKVFNNYKHTLTGFKKATYVTREASELQ